MGRFPLLGNNGLENEGCLLLKRGRQRDIQTGTGQIESNSVMLQRGHLVTPPATYLANKHTAVQGRLPLIAHVECAKFTRDKTHEVTPRSACTMHRITRRILMALPCLEKSAAFSYEYVGTSTSVQKDKSNSECIT
jgi:hypothetical protein